MRQSRKGTQGWGPPWANPRSAPCRLLQPLAAALGVLDERTAEALGNSAVVAALHCAAGGAGGARGAGAQAGRDVERVWEAARALLPGVGVEGGEAAAAAARGAAVAQLPEGEARRLRLY